MEARLSERNQRIRQKLNTAADITEQRGDKIVTLQLVLMTQQILDLSTAYAFNDPRTHTLALAHIEALVDRFISCVTTTGSSTTTATS